MTKRFLNKLVLASYSKGDLDSGKVDTISKKLNKHDLKAYIRALKLLEQQKKVFVVIPKSNLYNIVDLKKLFSNKDIVFQEDSTLLLGIKILDNDMVYEMSLKDRLNDIIEKVEQSYN